VRRPEENKGSTPSCSRTVAYRELARGHDCRLQNPVTLYSFRQKFWVTVLGRLPKFRSHWRGKQGIVLDFIRAELVSDGRPYHVVTLHVRFLASKINSARDHSSRSRVRLPFQSIRHPYSFHSSGPTSSCCSVLSPLCVRHPFATPAEPFGPHLYGMTFISTRITLYNA
jgi:hypothetical protein